MSKILRVVWTGDLTAGPAEFRIAAAQRNVEHLTDKTGRTVVDWGAIGATSVFDPVGGVQSRVGAREYHTPTIGIRKRGCGAASGVGTIEIWNGRIQLGHGHVHVQPWPGRGKRPGT